MILNGTGTPNASVEVFSDGQLVGTTTVNAQGSWTFDYTSVSLADGPHSFTARAKAGDVTSDLSAPLIVTVDTAAPALNDIALARSSDTGAAGDVSTSYSSVSLTGQAEAGTTIQLEGTSVRSIAANDGTFTLHGVTLQPGVNALTITAVDTAGNQTATSLNLERDDAAAPNDPVLEWVRAALEAIRADGSIPATATRALAMESVAVLDALNAIDGTPAYMVGLAAQPGADPIAAVASAAHAVLSYLYPAQTATFDARLAANLATVTDAVQRTLSARPFCARHLTYQYAAVHGHLCHKRN